ncbi:MAG: glycine cleavage system aminomethyltransferase GcvT [Candidatus Eiseniibacteriota bacterium]|nr:MAG: glycine cleavage system aminomethyltransferase GcvT [Candidatus Eisenbacteria bacterium]
MPRETPLAQKHRELGARFVEFAGWLMPVQYSGLVEEHTAVREAAGIFDVSHMGEIWFRGPGAIDAADGLVTNDISSLRSGQVLYTTMCTERGGIVDDFLAYRVGDEVLFVLNASNTEKGFRWIRSHTEKEAHVEDLSEKTVQVALQGPRAEDVLKKAGMAELLSLPHNGHVSIEIEGLQVLASRTGYTGEDGFELYHDTRDSDRLWNLLFEAGRGFGLKPVGLGARDTLRFEMGYCLYGNDIDESTTPFEAGLGWTVKLQKKKFLGREFLVRQKQEGVRRKLVGLEMLENAIPRTGYPVTSGGKEIGRVTSGTFSPSLKKGLAMAYLPVEASKPGTEVTVLVRGKEHRASVTKLPFYRRGSRK